MIEFQRQYELLFSMASKLVCQLVTELWHRAFVLVYCRFKLDCVALPTIWQSSPESELYPPHCKSQLTSFLPPAGCSAAEAKVQDLLDTYHVRAQVLYNINTRKAWAYSTNITDHNSKEAVSWQPWSGMHLQQQSDADLHNVSRYRKSLCKRPSSGYVFIMAACPLFWEWPSDNIIKILAIKVITVFTITPFSKKIVSTVTTMVSVMHFPGGGKTTQQVSISLCSVVCTIAYYSGILQTWIRNARCDDRMANTLSASHNILEL